MIGGFDSLQGPGIFFTTSSRPALGPTNPPIQWVPGALSLRVKGPRSRMRGAVPPVPQYALWRGAQLKSTGTSLLLRLTSYGVMWMFMKTWKHWCCSWSSWDGKWRGKFVVTHQLILDSTNERERGDARKCIEVLTYSESRVQSRLKSAVFLRCKYSVIRSVKKCNWICRHSLLLLFLNSLWVFQFLEFHRFPFFSLLWLVGFSSLWHLLHKSGL
jgi:hypothetical protein